MATGMSIEWSREDRNFANMEKAFIALGKKALTMNHYDLAEATDIKHPQAWKKFLQDGRVSAYIQDEFTAIQDSELRKLILDINNSSSVGKAQLINSLSKMLHDNDTEKTGPAYIYTYVPLTEAERTADNVQEVDHDIFLKTVSD